MAMKTFYNAITRKKTYTEDTMEQSELSRSMSLLDLTMLGVGTSLGLGAYVLAGSVARKDAGPAAIVSFIIAGIASIFAALCYAEFASRIPRAGSAYVYSYVCVGEALAYVIGWSMILEYLIGNATLARGIVGYIDSQAGKSMELWLNSTMPMDVEYLSPYPDFFAFLLIAVMSTLLAAGVKTSAIVNNVFTVLNLTTLLTVIIAGLFKVDPSNWNIPKSNIPEGVRGGEGGFLPYGLSGVTAGAAECFFGFVGFDSVAAAGEEARNPQRNIPLAICLSVSIVIVVYVSICMIITMMWPYYLQNEQAPLPYVFEMVGWLVVSWIVTVGAVSALVTSMLGGMFPPPRIIYAMANDGLLFKFLAKVHVKRKTPTAAIITAGVVSALGHISGLMSVFFELHHLVEMLSIGTLLAYTIVALCVLRLRYEDPDMEADSTTEGQRDAGARGNCLRFLDYFLNVNRKDKPTIKTSDLAKHLVWIFCVLQIVFNVLVTYLTIDWLAVGAISSVGFMMVLTMVVIGRQPNTTIHLTFKVPLVPLLPAFSMLINTYLMLQLQNATWVRLGTWMAIGLVIYLSFGIRSSVEGKDRRRKLEVENPAAGRRP